MSAADNKEERELETPRRRIRPERLALLILLCLAVIAGVLWLILHKRSGFTRAEIEKTYTTAASGQAGIAPFGDGLLRYSADGASFLDTEGRELWNVNYSMNAPRFLCQGSHALLADMYGTQAVILDMSGECGRLTTAEPIINAAVSAGGVTAVALERDLNSLICFYNELGIRLDIEISLEMAVSGYPMAMALSPDGSGLVLSMVSSQSGNLNSQLVFYNFTVGRSEANRLVGYFNHEGHLLTQIDYLSAKRVAAVSEDGLEIYSLEQENKPELKASVPFPGEIVSYAAANRREAFLCPEPGTGDLILSVYDDDGKECFSKKLSSGARGLTLGSELVMLQTDGRVDLWTYSGTSYFSGTLPQPGAGLYLMGKKLLQLDGNRIHQYRFR